LRNQDQIVAAMEGNLSSCQSQLGAAMQGRGPKATPIPNARPVRPSRRRERAKTPDKALTGEPKAKMNGKPEAEKKSASDQKNK